MHPRPIPLLPVAALAVALACGEADEAPAPAAESPAAESPAAEAPAAAPASAAAPDDLAQGLALALSTFETSAEGKPVPRSELLILTRTGGAWHARSYTDPESNVFHKAFAWTPPGGEPALVTLGGSAAAVKLWRKGADGLAPVETLWQADFGGKFSRMRDGEVADVDGDGQDRKSVV